MLTIAITGSDGHSSLSDYEVHLGNDNGEHDVGCRVTEVTPSTVKCILGIHPAGDYNLTVLIKQLGFSNSLPLSYQLSADDPDVNDGGYGGGRTIELTGKGFSMKTEVTVCDAPCKVTNVTGGNVLECLTTILPDHETKSGIVVLHCQSMNFLEMSRFSTELTLKCS